ncbi:MAG: hypothetical protein K1X70_09530 [Leptospirales bacterium]|nr:hypothetical protein [Leptospirales bacterium]
MKLTINAIVQGQITQLLSQIGPLGQIIVPDPDTTRLERNLDTLLNVDNPSKVSVLAMDGYRYSQGSFRQQATIPIVLWGLHDLTMRVLKANERFLFYSDDPPKIDLGDGGFLIFPTPLHSLLYAVWFEVGLRLYNTYHISPEFRKLVGPLTMRYSIAYNDLIQVDSNYYGPAIITAARIISRDRLNRCLLDQGSVDWFMRYFNGVENLQLISLPEVMNILKEIYGKLYHPPQLNAQSETSLFQLLKDKHWGFRSIHIQSIGDLPIKGGNIGVHNLCVQALAGLQKSRSLCLWAI